jgi:DNA-binding transcriptional MocR family regulator
MAVLNTIWMTPPLNAALTSQFIKDGTADKIVSAKLAEAARRFAVAKKALNGFSFEGLPSGFFIWLNLPSPWNGKEFELCAREKGVKVFCAEKFAVGSFTVPPAARISLIGTDSADELAKGFKIIIDMLSGGFYEINPIL